MKEEIEKIKRNAVEELNTIKNISELNELKVKYLGKKGEITAVLRGMGALSADERPVIGSLVNETRDFIEEQIKTSEIKLKKEHIKEKLEKEKIDITMPSKKVAIGSIHPITKIINEFKEIFIGLRI